MAVNLSPSSKQVREQVQKQVQKQVQEHKEAQEWEQGLKEYMAYAKQNDQHSWSEKEIEEIGYPRIYFKDNVFKVNFKNIKERNQIQELIDVTLKKHNVDRLGHEFYTQDPRFDNFTIWANKDEPKRKYVNKIRLVEAITSVSYKDYGIYKTQKQNADEDAEDFEIIV